MDFYVFIRYVHQYGEDGFARSENKFLVVLKKNKNTGIDPVSSFIMRHHQFELACVVWCVRTHINAIEVFSEPMSIGNDLC
jgi:hypothetical protein